MEQAEVVLGLGRRALLASVGVAKQQAMFVKNDDRGALLVVGKTQAARTVDADGAGDDDILISRLGRAKLFDNRPGESLRLREGGEPGSPRSGEFGGVGLGQSRECEHEEEEDTGNHKERARRAPRRTAGQRQNSSWVMSRVCSQTIFTLSRR